MNFKKYFLLYTLIPLAILSIASSYYRFIVTEDYLVEYEEECNPEVNSCFIGCKDDDCSAEYYYCLVTKHASQLMTQCGPDITDCESAQVCLPGEKGDCSVTFCDIETDGDACEVIEMGPTYENVEPSEVINNTTSVEIGAELII